LREKGREREREGDGERETGLFGFWGWQGRDGETNVLAAAVANKMERAMKMAMLSRRFFLSTSFFLEPKILIPLPFSSLWR